MIARISYGPVRTPNHRADGSIPFKSVANCAAASDAAYRKASSASGRTTRGIGTAACAPHRRRLFGIRSNARGLGQEFKSIIRGRPSTPSHDLALMKLVQNGHAGRARQYLDRNLRREEDRIELEQLDSLNYTLRETGGQDASSSTTSPAWSRSCRRSRCPDRNSLPNFRA